MNPMEVFNSWYEKELHLGRRLVPGACCLSTSGLDGFPNGRFVALKEVADYKFIVTGPVQSRKGMEIGVNSKVALTFWWPETERQVRVQGVAERISDQLADKYFSERSREGQIVSIISRQGEELSDVKSLLTEYDAADEKFNSMPISRPGDWGGYAIDPVRIEFMEFSLTRFHDRRLYELQNDKWVVKNLQP